MRFNQETLRWNRRTVKQIVTRDVIVEAAGEYDRFFASFGRAAKKYLATTLEPRELGGIMGIAWEKTLFKAMHTHIEREGLGLLVDVGATGTGVGGDFIFTDNNGRDMVLEVKITGVKTPTWITNAVAMMRKDHLTRPVNYILTAREDKRVFSAVGLGIGPNDWRVSKTARACSFDKTVFVQKGLGIGRGIVLIGEASKIGVAGGIKLRKDIF